MARSGRDRFLRRCRRRLPQAVHGDDRISALSDDLLLDILGRLDTRTILGAGMLSKRWAGLPRELPFLDLSVGDILPPRYHRWVLLHRDSHVRDLKYQFCTAKVEKVMPHIRRYERRAMRALNSSVERLLGAAADGVGRRVSRLTLEFFSTHSTGCINRLISTAIDAWGVHDLVAVAKPVYSQRRNFYAFPSHGICEDPRASLLRSLKLGGWMVPSLRGHNVLTVLVLQDTPMSTPESAYEGIFTSCPQLRVLHLISCYNAGNGNGDITVDAPRSEVRELVVDNCIGFTRICLRALPRLERLASLGTRVLFETTSFPCLRQCNLTLYMGVTEEIARRYFATRPKLKLSLFVGCIPDVTDLIIRFTGPDRWIVPPVSSPSLLPNLRRLLVADVPRCWDVSWPRLLLETAPSLETLHVHIAPPPCKGEEQPSGDEISWKPAMLGHRCLKEFVMVGFEGTERQVYLVRFVMGVCSTALCHVAVFKEGHVRDKGHWDWELVTQQQHSQWTDEEKDKTLKQIMNGVPSSSTAASPAIVFGRSFLLFKPIHKEKGGICVVNS